MKFCTCRSFQNDHRVCAHAIALSDHLHLSSIQFINRSFGKPAWQSVYSVPLPPVLRAGLEAEDLDPPAHKKRRGRPRKKRMETGQRAQRKSEAAVTQMPVANPSIDALSQVEFKGRIRIQIDRIFHKIFHKEAECTDEGTGSTSYEKPDR